MRFTINDMFLKTVVGMFIIFLFLFVENVSAEDYFQGDELKYTLLPNYPGAYEDVVIDLKSNYFNIDSSVVSVFEDGKLISEKTGMSKVAIKTKGVGEKSDVKIVIKKYNGDTKTKLIDITPAEVFLTYEVVGPYRPKGYLGKSIALSDSELRVFAFAEMVNEQGKRLKSSDLIYQWYVNYEIDPKGSGYGKDTYYIRRLNAYPRKTDITVKVYSPGGGVVAKKNLHFAPQKTDVDFYLIDENLPFSFKHLANPNIKSSTLDAKIIAVPYFMNYVLENAKITWKIDGKEADSILGKPLTIILSNNLQSFVESVNLFLRVKISKRILQSVEKNVKVEFLRNAIVGQGQSGGGAFGYDAGTSEKSFGVF